MSSLRNAVKRVEHKERAQPASRRKLGLLEKHKDYGERERAFPCFPQHINRVTLGHHHAPATPTAQRVDQQDCG